MKLIQKIALFSILSMLLVGIYSTTLAVEDVGTSKTETNKIILERNKGNITVSIKMDKEASIASFQIGLEVEGINISEDDFTWDSTLKKNAKLSEIEYNEEDKVLSLYYVGTEELNKSRNRI